MIYKQLWRKLFLIPNLRAWTIDTKRLCQVSLVLMRPAFCDRLGHDLGGLLHPHSSLLTHWVTTWEASWATLYWPMQTDITRQPVTRRKKTLDIMAVIGSKNSCVIDCWSSGGTFIMRSFQHLPQDTAYSEDWPATYRIAAVWQLQQTEFILNRISTKGLVGTAFDDHGSS